MKAISSVVQSDKTGYSLRTTIPSSLAQALKLKAGDQLEWSLKTGTSVIEVKRVE